MCHRVPSSAAWSCTVVTLSSHSPQAPDVGFRFVTPSLCQLTWPLYLSWLPLRSPTPPQPHLQGSAKRATRCQVHHVERADSRSWLHTTTGTAEGVGSLRKNHEPQPLTRFSKAFRDVERGASGSRCARAADVVAVLRALLYAARTLANAQR